MIWNAFLLALREIRRSALRSALTTLGIVIGIASVIAMVMLGDATTAYITQSISKLGTNMLILVPGQKQQGPPATDSTARRFTHSDIEALKKELANTRGVAPVGSSQMHAVYGNKNYATTVDGSDNDYFVVKDWVFASGREFSPIELQNGKAVCVIGETIHKELFGTLNPIGESIRLESFSCEVVGLLEAKGAAMFGMDQDAIIVTPIRMFQRRISGNKEIGRVIISANSSSQIQSVKDAVTSLMQERRKVKAGQSDFNVHDMREMVQTLSSTTQMLTILLGAVAAISLLVGGIGIMNIMLVSVTERTREIGIRLAIGALEREVLLQFLVEAIVLSSLGGVLGIVVGVGAGVGIAFFFDLPLIFNTFIVIVAFLFSTLVGIVFGYFPARKAARLNPIDALRHE